MENTTYLHEDMFSSEEETLHTLHNWIDLSAGMLIRHITQDI